MNHTYITFLLTLLLGTSSISYAQHPSQEIDTLRRYDVNLSEQMTTIGMKYLVNGKEITKEKYLIYKENWAISEKCHPCVMVTYDHNDRIKHIATQFMDCFTGEYKEYYIDGKLKTAGSFKENTSTDWSNLRMRNLCSVRHGKWTYYNTSGKPELIETYENGKLITSEVPADSNEKSPGIQKMKGFFKGKTEEGASE
jgi:hypothetical protein